MICHDNRTESLKRSVCASRQASGRPVIFGRTEVEPHRPRRMSIIQSRCRGKCCPSRIRSQEPAEPRGADNFRHFEVDGWFRRFVPSRRQEFAGSVAAFSVVPGQELLADVVEIPCCGDHKRSVQKLHSQSANAHVSSRHESSMGERAKRIMRIGRGGPTLGRNSIPV